MYLPRETHDRINRILMENWDNMTYAEIRQLVLDELGVETSKTALQCRARQLGLPSKTPDVQSKKKESLCWECRMPLFPAEHFPPCSWIDRGKPVRGWEAEQTMIRGHVTGEPPTPSYRVIKCPRFVPEPKRPKVILEWGEGMVTTL